MQRSILSFSDTHFVCASQEMCSFCFFTTNHTQAIAISLCHLESVVLRNGHHHPLNPPPLTTTPSPAHPPNSFVPPQMLDSSVDCGGENMSFAHWQAVACHQRSAPIGRRGCQYSGPEMERISGPLWASSWAGPRHQLLPV